MTSLEKKMFFLPNRLGINKEKMFVSFNIAVIPVDMNVTRMSLHIPVPPLNQSTKVTIREIIQPWSESSLSKGTLPKQSNRLYSLTCVPNQQEMIVDLSRFRESWQRKSQHNHGVSIHFRNVKQKTFQQENIPYLVVDTI